MKTIDSIRGGILLGLAGWACLAASGAGAQTWIDEGFTDLDAQNPAPVRTTNVALWGDILVVGMPNMDKPFDGVGPAVNEAGAILVYRRNDQNEGWNLRQTIFAPNAVDLEHFGTAVALRDGFLAVGQPGYGDAVFAKNQGRVLILVNEPSSLNPVNFTYQTDWAPGTEKLQAIGSSLAIERRGDGISSDDGAYIVVAGAPGEGGTTPESKQGRAYLNAWKWNVVDDGPDSVNGLGDSYLLGQSPGNPLQPARQDGEQFGASVAIVPKQCSPACSTLFYVAVGSPNHNYGTDTNHPDAGVVRVLELHTTASTNQWFDTLNFQMSHAHNGDHFGRSVALEAGDATQTPPQMIAGVPGAVNSIAQSTGAAMVYEGDITLGLASGIPPQFIAGPVQSTASGFGGAVKIKGNRAWVGASSYDIANASGMGAVFQLTRSAGCTWSITDELHADPDNVTGDHLGNSLAYDAGRLVVGTAVRGGFNSWLDDSLFNSSFEGC